MSQLDDTSSSNYPGPFPLFYTAPFWFDQALDSIPSLRHAAGSIIPSDAMKCHQRRPVPGRPQDSTYRVVSHHHHFYAFPSSTIRSSGSVYDFWTTSLQSRPSVMFRSTQLDNYLRGHDFRLSQLRDTPTDAKKSGLTG